MTKEQKTWGVGLCYYTKELIQDGFYLQGYDLYFSTEELLVQYLRTIDEDTNKDGETLSDEFLLKDWYDSDCTGEGYYYSEWHPENANYVNLDGDIYKIRGYIYQIGYND